MRRESMPAFLHELLMLYGKKRVSRSAAAMSYFMLLTVFPLLICLNYMLGSMFPTVERLYSFAGGLLPEETIGVLADYLRYISFSSGRKILPAGLALMFTSSAAVFRVTHGIMADLRGKARFRTLVSWPISFLFSLAFLAAMYFSALAVLLGGRLLTLISGQLRLSDPGRLWNTLRFPILFLILLTMLWGLYRLTAPREERNFQLPGALIAAAAVELLSALFSLFIGMSTKYTVVYGSLASMIVLELWLYLCCTIVIMGSAVNILRCRRNDGINQSAKRSLDSTSE